ncbi:hypothetical protein O1L55_20700 [Streptomyces albulus]|nr:hypothetical protein [Streptomyces noursei]
MKDLVQVQFPVLTTDRYGNTVVSYASDVEPITYRGRLYMTAGREETKDRFETEVSTWFLILPAECGIDNHCRVIHNEKKFNILMVQSRGEAYKANHLTVRLQEVEGWD